ncbi:MAG: hypothetical protein ACXWJU_05215 [Hyphomicrobium sp.]
MTDQRYPYTLRVLRTERGWGWVVLNHRNPKAAFRPEDVLDASAAFSFSTPEAAMEDAQEKFGAPVSPEVKDWTVWGVKR